MTNKRSEIKIILEICSYRKPTAWVAYSDDDIIHALYPDLEYESWTRNKVLEVYEEYDNVPDHFKEGLKDIKDDDEEIIYISFKDREHKFYKKDEAPTMLEAAESFLGYDMHSSYILTIEEAKDFIKTYRGHKCWEAIDAVNNKLKFLVD